MSALEAEPAAVGLAQSNGRTPAGRGSPGQPNVRGILARVGGRAEKHGAFAGSVVPAKPAPELLAGRWRPLPGSSPVPLDALADEGACVWPVKRPGEPQQLFCACDTLEGGRYCAAHAKRSLAGPAEVAAHRKMLRSLGADV